MNSFADGAWFYPVETESTVSAATALLIFPVATLEVNYVLARCTLLKCETVGRCLRPNHEKHIYSRMSRNAGCMLMG